MGLTMDLWMGIADISEPDLEGESLVSVFTVAVQSLSDEDWITNWAAFPDPENPGKMHSFVCITNFNGDHGIAREHYVLNYYGDATEEAAENGDWTEEGAWSVYKDPEGIEEAYGSQHYEEDCI